MEKKFLIIVTIHIREFEETINKSNIW